MKASLAPRQTRWRRLAGLLAGLAILATGCSGSSPTSTTAGGGSQITLHALFMKQAAYSDTDIKAMTDAFTKDHPNITVAPEYVAYDALHDKIVTAQVGGGGVYDLVLVDTPWPAEMVKAGIITDITDKIPSDFKTGVFDAAWTAAKYNDKIYGVPWINDTKFFFYNEKILNDAGISAAPATWDEVEAAAKAVKAKGTVKYPIIASWKQAEAVICEWTQLAGAMGGSDFVDAQGNAKFNQGGGLAALTFMRKLIDEGLVDPTSLSSTEDDVNAAMATGQYAMTLNWTYGLAVMNDPKSSKVPGQIKVAPSPGQGAVKTSGVNGGMSLAVTSTSKHPAEALQYALALASEKSQEMDVANALPMWQASFDKPDVTKNNPTLFAAAKVQFGGLVARPVVPYYTKLSNALQDAIQQALLGKKSPAQALDDVAAQLPTFQK